LSFTSPTLVLTNFFVAQAVELATASATIGIATSNLRMIGPSSYS
jgi:hypothetical protein